MDNATLRFALRATAAGVLAFLTAVQAVGFNDMDGGSWFNAAVAGVVVALSFAGVTSVTPIDASVGVGKGVKK